MVQMSLQGPIAILRQDLTHRNISDPTIVARDQRSTALRTKLPLNFSGINIGLHIKL